MLGCSLGGTLLAAVASAKTEGGERAAFRLNHLIEETFDNGLHVIVCPVPGAGLVDVRVEVSVGTWLEGSREGVGLSHFFEHLILGGTTQTRKGVDSTAMLRAAGGMSNARTDTDRTWFEIQAPPGGMSVAVELLADWIRNAALDEDEIARERGVMQGEFAKAADEDMRQAWDNLLRTAYLRHPSRLPIIGDAARLDSITREELLRFKAAHYIPRASVVAITGDIDPVLALAAVRARFADWSGPYHREAELAREPDQNAPRYATRTGTGTLSSVAIGYRTVGQTHGDAPILDVIQHALVSGRDGRVYNRAVQQERWTAGATALSWNPARGGGVLVVMAATRPDQVASLVEGVSGEIERLANDRLSEGELTRAKAQLRAATVFSLESTAALGHRLATDYLTTGSCRHVERYLDRVAAVSVEDVLRVAKTYLHASGRTVSVVEPKPVATNPAAVPSAASPEPVADSSRARTEQVFASGAIARIEQRPGTGTVAIHAAFPAGTWCEREHEGGATAVLVAMLRPSEEARRIAERLEAGGGQLDIGYDPSTIYFEARVVADDLGDAIAWVVSRAGAPGLDPATFSAQVASARDQLAARRGAFRREADDRLRAALFEGPAARTVVGDEASLDRLTPDALQSFADATFRADHVQLAVVGDVLPAEVRRIAEPLVATLPRGAPRAVLPLGEPALSGDVVWISSARRQAVIALGFAGARVDAADDRVALDILDTYVCGRRVSGGVLYDALRVDNDLAYFIDSSNQPMPGGGFFQLVVQCDPLLAGEVLEAIDAVLARVASGELDEDALAGARQELLISRAMADQTASSRARMLALGGVWGLPLDSIERYRTQVLQVDTEVIRAVAARVLGGDRRRVMLWPEGVTKP